MRIVVESEISKHYGSHGITVSVETHKDIYVIREFIPKEYDLDIQNRVIDKMFYEAKRTAKKLMLKDSRSLNTNAKRMEGL